jgi:tetratricopeptide (TPR) repeat protein
MVCRALVGIFLASFAVFCFGQIAPMNPNGPYPGAPSQPNWNTAAHNFSSISGSVLGADNRPADHVRVELRDGRTGTVLTSIYTTSGGAFEFNQLPRGSYAIVASAGTEQVEERVELHSINSSVTLRLQGQSAAPASDGNGKQAVSVAQLKVPQAARDELKKAQEATLKSRIDEAQQHVEKALGIDPDYADALTLRAILKLDSRDTDGAVADLQKAIQSDANYAMAFMVLGSAFNAQLKYDDAIHALERAQTLAPDAWQAYFEMGRACDGKGDYQAAIRSFDRAQRLAPQEYPLIRLIRAHSLMGLTRYGDAIAELEAFLQKNPVGPDADQAQKMLEKAKEAAAETPK